jgi:hypothetical protein
MMRDANTTKPIVFIAAEGQDFFLQTYMPYLREAETEIDFCFARATYWKAHGLPNFEGIKADAADVEPDLLIIFSPNLASAEARHICTEIGELNHQQKKSVMIFDDAARYFRQFVQLGVVCVETSAVKEADAVARIVKVAKAAYLGRVSATASAAVFANI